MKNENKSIVIDGHNLSFEKGTGIATYARNLSYALHELNVDVNVLYGKPALAGKSDFIKEISFFNVVKKSVLRDTFSITKKLITTPFGQKARELPITGKVISTHNKDKLPYFDTLWNIPWLFDVAQIYFRLYKRFYPIYLPRKLDIMHWTYPVPIWAVGKKNIYTVHDIVPLRLPYTTYENKSNYLSMMNTILTKAHHICTVSENSKQDLVNIFQVPAEKITNTYQAVNIPEQYLTCDIEDIKSDIYGAYNLNYKEYFLFFGAIEPKKNVGRIIEAFLSTDIKIPLILASGSGWMAKQELRMILDENFRSRKAEDYVIRKNDRIKKIDHVPFRQLVNLIRGAKAVLFPSIYEGFGLPILESMLCGTPVLTSNFGAMKETAGDAALSVDPYDVRKIRDAIELLNNDNELKLTLSKQGLSRVKTFNQDNYKARLKCMYEKI